MRFENLSSEGLDYLPCRYGASKLMFRGPRKKLQAPYIAVLGGTETYGKFMETPLSEVLQQATGVTTVNLGHLNAGIDAFHKDAVVLEICNKAKVVVIQIMGPQNMSNRLYTVHPRRNDRFVKASKFLHSLYRDIDFTQFHYTRHLLSALRAQSAKRYGMVVEELQAGWLSRMRMLVSEIQTDVCLLWMSDRAPDENGELDPLGHEPLFVSRAMLDDIGRDVAEVVEVVATRDEIDAGRDRMIFSPLEEPVASEMLGPVVHETAARLLQEKLGRYLG